MEIHQSISQNTLSFLLEKLLYFKVDSCEKVPFPIELTSVARLLPQCDSDVYHIG